MSPELERLSELDHPEAIIRAIREARFPGFELGRRLENLVVESVMGNRHSAESLHTPLNDTTVSSIQDIEVVEVRVSQLDANLLNIDVEGQIDIELFGFMDRWDYFGRDHPEVSLDNGNWNDHVVSAYSTTRASLLVSVVFGQARHEIELADVDLSSNEE